MKKLTILITLFLIVSSLAFAQISISNYNFTYTQDFNSLASTGTNIIWTDNATITGWYSSRITYDAGTGNSNTGALYSFGSTGSSDRALGSMPTNGTGDIFSGVRFTNNTGQTITTIPISYIGEQWRTAGNQTQKLDFQYQIGNAGTITNITSGTWTDVDALDFTGPIASTPPSALDGNASANRVSLSSTLSITVLSGQEIWFRWMNLNASSKDHGLGIDDFVFNPAGGSLPVELASFSAILFENSVKLVWRTETEVSNYGFEIERLQDYKIEKLQDWNKIGFLQGYGNSNSPKDYSFMDNSVSAGKYSYRLKQIDTDGQYEYSKVIEIDLGSSTIFELNQNYPNPFNPETTIRFALSESGNIKLTIYNIVGEQVAVLVDDFKEKGVHTFNFDASSLNSGIYVYKIEANGFAQARKMTLVK
jgi:hypothetical protein